MGVAMLGMWLMFYATGSNPEVETRPIEPGMHLLAEGATALLLIVGGLGLLACRGWGLTLYLPAMGMLIYTLLMSPGYFLQRGEYGLGIMFAAFLIVGLALQIPLARSSRWRSA